jgi:hypothetical protein
MEKALAWLQELFVWLLDLGSNQGPADKQKTVLSNNAVFIGFHSLV